MAKFFQRDIAYGQRWDGGLAISFTPSLHAIANFSGFIGVLLSGICYRWIVRDERAPVSG